MTDADDTLRCPAHPDAAAVAACVECGRWVCADCRGVMPDGLTACPDCRAEAEQAAASPPPAEPPPVNAAARAYRAHTSGAEPELPLRPVPAGPTRAAEPRVQVVGPTPVAWEHDDGRSDFMAFVYTAREALMGPGRYMARVPWVLGDLRTPLIFALLAGVIGRLGLMMLVPVTGFPGAPVGAIQPASAAEALANAAILPLRITALVFICAGLAHLMLKLAGDPPRPFEATFRVYAYAEVSSLLLLLPWVGPYAARFYLVLLLLTGYRLAQNAGFSASLLAMAPGLVVSWVLA